MMPKWCEWSFLLELLYLEQPSAAVAYSHFSPRWWHFHNGFFRWISSSSWTFWQKKAPIFEASIGGPDCFFLGCLVPTGTKRKATVAAPSKRQGRDSTEEDSNANSTCRNNSAETISQKIDDEGRGFFSNGPQFDQMCLSVCKLNPKCNKATDTGDDWWWLLLVMTGAMKSSVGNGWCDKWSNPKLVDVEGSLLWWWETAGWWTWTATVFANGVWWTKSQNSPFCLWDFCGWWRLMFFLFKLIKQVYG